MSKTLDALERVIHGTPAGFKGGCKSRGGCPNARHRDELTCVRAYIAYVHYFIGRIEIDPHQPITRAMVRNAKNGVRDPQATPRKGQA